MSDVSGTPSPSLPYGPWLQIVILCCSLLSLICSVISLIIFDRFLRLMRSSLNLLLMLATAAAVMISLIRSMIAIGLLVDRDGLDNDQSDVDISPVVCKLVVISVICFETLFSGFLSFHFFNIAVILKKGEAFGCRMLRVYIALVIAFTVFVVTYVAVELQYDPPRRMHSSKELCHLPLSTLITEWLPPIVFDCIMLCSGVAIVVKVFLFNRCVMSDICRRYLFYRVLYLILLVALAGLRVIEHFAEFDYRSRHYVVAIQVVIVCLNGVFLFVVFATTEGPIYLMLEYIAWKRRLREEQSSTLSRTDRQGHESLLTDPDDVVNTGIRYATMSTPYSPAGPKYGDVSPSFRAYCMTELIGDFANYSLSTLLILVSDVQSGERINYGAHDPSIVSLHQRPSPSQFSKVAAGNQLAGFPRSAYQIDPAARYDVASSVTRESRLSVSASLPDNSLPTETAFSRR